MIYLVLEEPFHDNSLPAFWSDDETAARRNSEEIAGKNDQLASLWALQPDGTIEQLGEFYRGEWLTR
jgi:hypothetical protein